MGRAPCCDKSNVKRGPWSPDEDATLKNYLQRNGTAGNWISLPQRAGLKRCGKSCRLRWLNYLRPDIKHGAFTEEEDNTIISMYYKMGSRWSVIAANLPGRTDNDVKNHWNTKLKKKLFAETSNNKTFNPIINPIVNTQVTFTTNNIINPNYQVTTSFNPTPNYIDHNNGTNQVHNHQINVPIPSFSELLAQCTTSTTSMSYPLYTNFSTLAIVDQVSTHDPFGNTNSTRYPFQHSQLMPHEEVSSASGSSSAVYGSNFEDADPFLAEFGFGLMQEEVMTSSFDVDQEDIKPPQGLGQGVAN